MGQVQVILSEDVHALGDAGEVVSAKPGYARNYLIPQGKALIATAERVNEVEHKKRVISEKRAKELKDLEAVKAKLDATALEISAQAGEEGKLFGSVTAAQLADLLREKGLDVDRRKIQLAEPIKTTGEHTVAIRLRSVVLAELKVTVTAAELARSASLDRTRFQTPAPAQPGRAFPFRARRRRRAEERWGFYRRRRSVDDAIARDRPNP